MDQYQRGRVIVLSWFIWLALTISAFAGVPCSVPFTLTNGTTADATQVMANYNAILTCLTNAAAAGSNSDITALNALTTPIPPGSGGSNVFISTAATGGSANAQTVTTTIPTGFSATTNYSIITKIGITNTGATTLTAPNTGAINVFKKSFLGSTALTGGELVTGDIALFTFDGTNFQVDVVHNQTGGFDNESSINSASTTDIASLGNHSSVINGVTTITNFGNTLAGNQSFPIYRARIGGSAQINFNGTNCGTTGGCILTPGGVNITTSVNDVLYLRYFGQGSNGGVAAGNWIVDFIARNAGVPRLVTNPQTFTATGTYTPTVGMLFADVECSGAGGAGGGVTATANMVGAGGGAAGYVRGFFGASTIGASQTVTIGTGGTGISGATGNSGGNTTFGALLTANGGSGGTGAVTNQTNGAAGGTASGGFLQRTGDTGGYAFIATGAIVSGQGASALYGAGGPAISLPSGTHAGNNATGFGSAGGGAQNFGTATAQAGGNGANGLCIVHEYIL